MMAGRNPKTDHENWPKTERIAEWDKELTTEPLEWPLGWPLERLLEQNVYITLGELLLHGDDISRSIYESILEIRKYQITPEAFQSRDQAVEEECDAALDTLLSSKAHISWGEVLCLKNPGTLLSSTDSHIREALEAYRRDHAVLADRSYWMGKVLGSKTTITLAKLEEYCSSASSQDTRTHQTAQTILEALLWQGSHQVRGHHESEGDGGTV